MASSGSGGSTGSSHWVAIAIALITTIGTVIAAIIGYPQVVIKIEGQGQATGVALLQPTIDSLRDQATPTNMPVLTLRSTHVRINHMSEAHRAYGVA